jgi:hypothetical protein
MILFEKSLWREQFKNGSVFLLLGQFLAIPDNTWGYPVITGNTCENLEILGNIRRCLSIPGDTWQYLTILLQYLPIPNNTHQFQTIPIKLGIGWYHLVSTMHHVSLPI